MYHFVENKVLTFYIWVLYDGVVDDMKPITYITLYVVPRTHLFNLFDKLWNVHFRISRKHWRNVYVGSVVKWLKPSEIMFCLS